MQTINILQSAVVVVAPLRPIIWRALVAKEQSAYAF